jgi:hypothetical protein
MYIFDDIEYNKFIKYVFNYYTLIYLKNFYSYFFICEEGTAEIIEPIPQVRKLRLREVKIP